MEDKVTKSVYIPVSLMEKIKILMKRHDKSFNAVMVDAARRMTKRIKEDKA